MQKLIHIMLAMVTAAGVALAGSAVPARAAATFTVDSTVDQIDANPGDGLCRTTVNLALKCTLRAAIMEANALAGADTINLPAGVYTLTRLGVDDNAVNGDLDITGDLTINGAGASTSLIDGNGNTTLSRVFDMLSGNVTISDVTVENGVNPGGAGGIRVNANSALTLNNSIVTNNGGVATGDFAGGILNSGTLTINNSLITNNFADPQTGHGGGILSKNILTINNSTISGNSAGTGGGLDLSGTATITNTIISNNTVFGQGGAIANAAQTSITASTIRNNTSNTREGGGIWNTGNLVLQSSTVNANVANETNSANGQGGGGLANIGSASLINSTFSGNSAKLNGGGLLNLSGTINLASTTIANNTADSDHNNSGNGGGIAIVGGTVNSKNTLMADNVDASPSLLGIKHPDCSGTLTSPRFNLIENTTGCTLTGHAAGNKLGIDPGLGPLQDNGGPTLTHTIDFGPALDSGDPNGCTDTAGVLLARDQRGLGRHQGAAGGPGRCDIGAVETVQPA